MIGHYGGNEMLAIACQLCPKPILPGQLYMGNGGDTKIHYACWLENQSTARAKADLTRQGLDHHA